MFGIKKAFIYLLIICSLPVGLLAAGRRYKVSGQYFQKWRTERKRIGYKWVWYWRTIRRGRKRYKVKRRRRVPKYVTKKYSVNKWLNFSSIIASKSRRVARKQATAGYKKAGQSLRRVRITLYIRHWFTVSGQYLDKGWRTKKVRTGYKMKYYWVRRYRRRYRRKRRVPVYKTKRYYVNKWHGFSATVGAFNRRKARKKAIAEYKKQKRTLRRIKVWGPFKRWTVTGQAHLKLRRGRRRRRRIKVNGRWRWKTHTHYTYYWRWRTFKKEAVARNVAIARRKVLATYKGKSVRNIRVASILP